jgi:hypothetical protein
MYTIVLSNSRRETMAWAQANELPLVKVRHAQNGEALAGRFFERIVELPSFKKRRDIFSIKAALKRLERARPDLFPIEVQADWVIPERRKQIEPTSQNTWLLGDLNPLSNAVLADPADTEEPEFNQKQAEAAMDFVAEVGEGLEKIDDKLTDAGGIPAPPALSTEDLYALAVENDVDVIEDLREELPEQVQASLETALEQSAAGDVAPLPAPKRKGRPVGSKNKPKPALKPEATPGVSSGAPDLDF